MAFRCDLISGKLMRKNLEAASEKKAETRRDPYEHYKQVRIAENYDKDRFDSIPGAIFDRLEKKRVLAAFVDVPKGATILDVPCGTGRLAEALLEAGYRVFGVDISPAMLHIASRKLQRYGDRFQTMLGDLRRLTDDDRCFDAALCVRLLMHVPLEEQIALLSNVARLSSRVVVFDQSLDTPYQRFRRLIKKGLRHQRPVAHPVSRQQLQFLVDKSGLKIDRRLHVCALVSEAIVVRCVRDRR